MSSFKSAETAISDIDDQLRQPLIDEDSDEDGEEQANKPLNFRNLIKMIPRTSYLIFNLMAVYFFEYVILMSFANAMDVRMKIKYPEFIDKIEIKNFFLY